MPDTSLNGLIIGVITLALTNIATLIGLVITGYNTRAREKAQALRELAAAKVLADSVVAAAKDKADAIAAAARLVDERADRDRRWMIEDRQALEVKVQATADTLAAKVAADQSRIAAELVAHQTGLARAAKSDQEVLVEKVDVATVSATAAVDELKVLMQENTEISTSAFHEANGAKELLAQEVQRRNEIQIAQTAAAGVHRRSSDVKPGTA